MFKCSDVHMFMYVKVRLPGKPWQASSTICQTEVHLPPTICIDTFAATLVALHFTPVAGLLGELVFCPHIKIGNQ